MRRPPSYLSTKGCILVSLAAGGIGLALIWAIPQPPPDPGLKARLETLKESDAFLGKN